MRLSQLCILAGSLTGCLEMEPDAPAGEPAYRVLDTVATPGGGSLEFGVLPEGGITMMEYAQVGAPSPMSYYTRRYDATPLEIYQAIAPDRAAPTELVADHAALVQRQARRLDTPTRVAAAFDAPYYEWYYSADCSLASDGGWFDDFWSTYGYNWHWYHRVTDYEDRSPTAASTNLQIHLCNDGGVTPKVLKVMQSGDCGSGNWSYIVNAQVDPQHRRQFRVTNGPSQCYYQAIGENKIGYSSLPWYDLGFSLKP
jgi:hypothetical protein